MPNKIFPVKDFEFKSNKTYFFDNNVWVSLYAPLINTKKDQQNKASKFLKNLFSYNSQIIVSSLILSEFSNTYVRFGFEQWKKATYNPTANYKRDYKKTQNFKDTLEEVKTLIKGIIDLEITSNFPDDFNAIDFEKVLNSFEIDYNDSYYFQQCNINNWILVTSDGDFDNIDGNLTIVKI